MMHRFFVPPEWISLDTVVFQNPVAHQISRVLRLHPGEKVMVLDNRGSEYAVELVEMGQTVMGQITGQSPVTTEPTSRIAMYLSLTQREKFEWMLQKCTEVGASQFTPVVTERTLINRSQASGTHGVKQERWERIILEAAEQCGRGLIPVFRLPLVFKEALEVSRRENELLLIPYEGEKGLPLTQAIHQLGEGAHTLALFIGPEGGFTDQEIHLARQVGVTPVSLGRRILRMETAAIVALALAYHALGE